MARSARIHPERKAEVLQSLERNGFLTQGALAGHLEMALSTVNNFINSKRVYISKFEEICDALGLEPQDLIQGRGEAKKPSSQVKETLPINFAAYDDCWVGREQLTQQLKNRLLNSSRLLIILGLTGIGKTALAERISLETEEWFDKDWQQGFLRVSFEAAQQNKDFATVARQWLEKLQVNISPQECHPEQLLLKISDYLQQQRVLVLIDSLENLLTGNEQEGWGSFQDSFWQRFFLNILTAPNCQSRIIVTSQELPTQLVEQRYQQLWHCQVLQGLTEEEQKALIEIMGFDISSTSKDKPLLLRLGRAYQGHPLVLRVILGEINESFRGNVQAYWHEVAAKIEAVENAIAQAEADAKQAIGTEDDWKLHKLTRKVRLEVNRQRLKAVFERLATQVPDAYWLICVAAIYRVPVQVEGWLLQLSNLVKRIEQQGCSEERQEQALLELSHRFLVEEGVNHNNRLVLGLHSLVRSVALEHYQKLIAQLKVARESA